MADDASSHLRSGHERQNGQGSHRPADNELGHLIGQRQDSPYETQNLDHLFPFFPRVRRTAVRKSAGSGTPAPGCQTRHSGGDGQPACDCGAPIEFPEGPAGLKRLREIRWWEARPVPEGGMWLGVDPLVFFGVGREPSTNFLNGSGLTVCGLVRFWRR